MMTEATTYVNMRPMCTFMVAFMCTEKKKKINKEEKENLALAKEGNWQYFASLVASASN